MSAFNRVFRFCRDTGKIKFIRSQKKNAQLVYKGFIYNKKLTQANGHTTWRCCDVLKTKCKAVCVTKNNRLLAVRREHIHPPHWSRIGNRPLYSEEDDLGDFVEVKSVKLSTEVFSVSQLYIERGGEDYSEIKKED